MGKLDERELQDYESARRSPMAAPLAHRIRFAKYAQWLAFEQWQQVRRHARQAGVLLKGDLAFVCGANSADVWAHQQLFDLRSSAGTPPDAFSETGQLWELPVYNWEALRRSDYAWWPRAPSGRALRHVSDRSRRRPLPHLRHRAA